MIFQFIIWNLSYWHINFFHIYTLLCILVFTKENCYFSFLIIDNEIFANNQKVLSHESVRAWTVELLKTEL